MRQGGVPLRAWIVLSKANITVFDGEGGGEGEGEAASAGGQGTQAMSRQSVSRQVQLQVPDPALRLVSTALLTVSAARGSGASTYRNLLLESAQDEDVGTQIIESGQDPTEAVSHWKYARHPLTFRVVTFGSRTLYRAHLRALQLQLHTRRRYDADKGTYQAVYEPQMYVDDLSLMRRHRLQISSNLSYPSPRLLFKYVGCGRSVCVCACVCAFRSLSGPPSLSHSLPLPLHTHVGTCPPPPPCSPTS